MKALTRALCAIAVACAVTLTASGCGSQASDSAKRARASSQVPSGSNSDLAQPRGAISTLRNFKCEVDAQGHWNASGDIASAATSKQRFLVTISVVHKTGNTVEGARSVTLPVGSGATAHFDLPNVFTGDSGDLICVPRVVSGQ